MIKKVERNSRRPRLGKPFIMITIFPDGFFFEHICFYNTFLQLYMVAWIISTYSILTLPKSPVRFQRVSSSVSIYMCPSVVGFSFFFVRLVVSMLCVFI